MTAYSRPNQFALPRGLLGRLVGRLMAIANADMYRVVVEMLALRGDERVLEVGFGPGIGIALLAQRLPRGQVFGVDPSHVMLRQATRRNRQAVTDSRVELRIGTATRLPWEDGYFDAVCSVNTVQLWIPLDESMREVRRVMTPRGRLAIGVHSWVGMEQSPDRRVDEAIETSLRKAGFTGVMVGRRRARSGKAIYFSARA